MRGRRADIEGRDELYRKDPVSYDNELIAVGGISGEASNGTEYAFPFGYYCA